MTTNDTVPGVLKLIADVRKLREVADDTGRSRRTNGYALNTRSAIEMVRLEASIIERIGTFSGMDAGAGPVMPHATADAERRKLQHAVDKCAAARTAVTASATNELPKE